MLQQCHSLSRLLQDCGCSWRDRCRPGRWRQLLSTVTWTLQSRLDMRSFSCLTIRASDGAPPFRVGEIFRCHSGGCSQSLFRDTVKMPGRVHLCAPRDCFPFPGGSAQHLLSVASSEFWRRRGQPCLSLGAFIASTFSNRLDLVVRFAYLLI
jgi:hypothetical protein